MLHNDQSTKSKLTINLKKVEGMTRKISEMIDDEVYCGNIIQQINATIGLLKKMNHTMLASHLLTCGKKKLDSKDPAESEAFVAEILRLVEKG